MAGQHSMRGLKRKRSRTRRLVASVRARLAARRRPVEDVEQAGPDATVVDTHGAAAIALALAAARRPLPAPSWTPRLLIDDMHAKCPYLPRGPHALRWTLFNQGAQAVLGALDAPNAGLRRIVRAYATALRADVLEATLPGGVVVLNVAATLRGIRVVVRAELAPETDAPDLLIERDARAVVDDTEVFDAIRTGPHIPVDPSEADMDIARANEIAEMCAREVSA